MQITRRIADSLDETRSTLDRYREQGLRVFATSSFQTHSVPLLHILAKYAPEVSIHFIDTGFHFPETLAFRDEVATLLGIEVSIISSTTPMSRLVDPSGLFLFATDPDQCCWINKTKPTEELLKSHDVWITGVRREQNEHRRELASEMSGPHETIRFHPMLHWDESMISEYRRRHGLPPHPLDAFGYTSVGCAPCTSPSGSDPSDRSGRWAGLTKSECGLHSDLLVTK